LVRTFVDVCLAVLLIIVALVLIGVAPAWLMFIAVPTGLLLCRSADRKDRRDGVARQHGEYRARDLQF